MNERALSTASIPDIADTNHASQGAVEFFRGYYSAKSRHDAEGWLQYFHPSRLAYYDATLGLGTDSRPVMEKQFREMVSMWPENARSYPVRILGDTTSAVVVFVDTPELFGAELRIIAAVDFRDGKVTRQADYWDGRRNSAISLRGPDDQYPHGLGLETVLEIAAPEMDRTARQLNAALVTGDDQAAAALFSADAVFEDLSTRTRVEGRSAIGRYLRRALAELPYGPGATLRHVLGSAQGGGYEWQTNSEPVRNGITALELDGDSAITRLTAVWDASRMSDAAMRWLTTLSIED
jgi:ketosteroid isomerase-like protein